MTELYARWDFPVTVRRRGDPNSLKRVRVQVLITKC